MAQNSVSALQLFGIIAADPGAMSPAHGTTLVHFRAIAAVVAAAPYQRVALDDEAVQAFAQTIEAIYRQGAVLPAPPGTIFRSKSALSRWLELHYVALTDALALVEGNSAARVTIRLRKPPEKEETIHEWLLVATESLRTLRTKATSLTLLDAGTEDAAVVGRASFLMERDGWTAFENSLQAESRRHPSLEFAVTGPWPPYDFVSMQFGG